MTRRPVFVSEGGFVGCTNGHALYKAKRTIYLDEIMGADGLERVDARVPEPHNGDPVPRICPECSISLRLRAVAR